MIDISDEAFQTIDICVADTDEILNPEKGAPYQATEELDFECDPEDVENIVTEAAEACIAV